MRTLLKQSTWVLLAALLALPQTVDAQQRPQTHEGFFIGIGLGFGSLGCQGCGSRESSAGADFHLGTALSQQVLLGVASSVWTKNYQGGATITHGTLVAMVQLYPSPTSGFWVRGGIGGARLAVSGSGGGVSFSASSSGLGMNGGAGYDVRVGDNFSVTPYGVYAWGDFDGGSADHFQLGVAANWH